MIDSGTYVRAYTGKGYTKYVEGVVLEKFDGEAEILSMYEVVDGDVQDVWLGESRIVQTGRCVTIYKPFWESRLGHAYDCYAEALEEKV